MESRIGFRDLPRSLKAYSTLGVNPIFRETYGMVSAGFTYTGQRFEDNFADFIKKYGFRDMYSCGFYPFESLEEYWAYWLRYVFINRYRDSDNGTYKRLFALVKDKDYFVLTTNVDHQFQKQDLINTDYFTRRAIMDYFNAADLATMPHMIMKRLSEIWLRGRRI